MDEIYDDQVNKLPSAKRAQIFQMMVGGVSIRAIVRMTGVSKNTVVKLMETAGEVFSAYMDEHFRNLPCTRVQVDEIWSFVYAKGKDVPPANVATDYAVWTWVAICADTKLVPSFYVGGRGAFAAHTFSMRMGMRRFTRPTSAFSKKLENYAHALAIYFMHYNFVRIHQSLRVTPAMAAGVTDKLFDMADLVAIVETTEAKPGTRAVQGGRCRAGQFKLTHERTAASQGLCKPWVRP